MYLLLFSWLDLLKPYLLAGSSTLLLLERPENSLTPACDVYELTLGALLYKRDFELRAGCPLREIMRRLTMGRDSI